MSEHLTPELFVDVLEKSPVESRWRQHLATCATCAAELRSIEQAFRMVTEPEVNRVEARRWISRPVLAAAALLLAALGLGLGLVSYRSDVLVPAGDEGAHAEARDDAILPPLGEDEGFELLLGFSAALPEDSLVEAVDLGTDASAPMAWELYDLTPGERQALIERLATETEGGTGS